MTVAVRITQLDGKLPNLALMKLAAWHKSRGDDVRFERSPRRLLDEPRRYDAAYASAIFEFSRDRVERFQQYFPEGMVGGTGSAASITVEQIVGDNFAEVDYSHWPTFKESIGFTQRGCRLKCSFCVVPRKEGSPVSVATINDIWRGEGHPKHIHLLDNDFYGNPDWRDRIAEIRDGRFKVCFNQGINARILTNEVAQALASVEYRDDSFSQRRLYTAWDNLGDERPFFRGVERLRDAGVPPKHLMAYMLVGFADDETWEGIEHRFWQMADMGIRPYPMVFDCRGDQPDRYRRLKQFQRWAVTGLYRAVPWSEYDSARKKRPSHENRQEVLL